MEKQKQWRIEYAEYLSQSFAKTTTAFNAIFIGGSVSAGFVDEYSDLELCFIWKNKVDFDALEKFYQKEQLKIVRKTTQKEPLQYIEHTIFDGDFQIDIFHYTHSEFQKILLLHTQITDLDMNAQNILYVVSNCIILKGKNYIQSIQNSIKKYSFALSEKMIRENISPFFRADIELFSNREDLILFYSLLSGYQKRIFFVLLGLNKIYFPTLKNIHLFVSSKLKIKPSKSDLFFHNIYTLPKKDAVQLLFEIKVELLKIIETKYPQIDIKDIYNNKIQSRKPNFLSPKNKSV